MVFAHEIYIAVATLVLFALSMANASAVTARKFTLALGAGAIISALMAFDQTGELFYSTYRVDGFSQAFKILIAVGFFLAVAFSEGAKGVDQEYGPEYFMFLAFSVMGLTFLVSSVELLTVYISLELSSYSLYIMVPMRRGTKFTTHVEAGIKYVLFGAVASGVSLFGMSYVYGLAQTTNLDELVKVFPQLASTPMGLVGLTMLLGGFFFKLALFPFHLWTPDIYQGAANETSGVIATLPKIGAVAVLIRLVGMGGADGGSFTMVLIILAVLSMTYGNLAALVQDDLKRLLAFSSISHAGYMMTGILSGTIGGYSGAMFYVTGYMVMNLALFYVIYSLAPTGDNVTIDDLKGLYKRAPLLAFTLGAAAFGLAGIPPMAGFAGKFFVLAAALEKGYTALVIIAAVNTAIAIYYYLKMVRAAYTQEADADREEAVPVSMGMKLLGTAFVVSIILIGSLPGYILSVFRSALAWVV